MYVDVSLVGLRDSVVFGFGVRASSLIFGHCCLDWHLVVLGVLSLGWRMSAVAPLIRLIFVFISKY